MKFSKLFEIHQSDEDNEHYICIEDIFAVLKKYDKKANKYNLKRSLQKFQGGLKTVCGKESATVFSVLKYLFVNAQSKSCETVVKNIIRELLNTDSVTTVQSSLELYRRIAKTKIHQNLEIFDTVQFHEETISTLILEHKPAFTAHEWKLICWFESHFSKDHKVLQRDISYEEVLTLKYAKYRSLLDVIKVSKKWTEVSSEQIRQKNIRYIAAEQDSQIRITAAQTHIVSVLDEEIKALADRICPDSTEHALCFNPTKPVDPNSLRALLVYNKDLSVNFEDLCSRIFYHIKRKHNVYIESILLIKNEQLGDYINEEGHIYRFHLRDQLETKGVPCATQIWDAGALVDGTVEIEDGQCQTCFSSILSQPLSAEHFTIEKEWYLELPMETQILLENFISKDALRKQTHPEILFKKKLEKLYAAYDTLLNIRNKKYIGLFQKDNSNKLLIEYKTIGSVFDITSSVGATSSLSQAETQLRSRACKDLLYYNTYLKEHNIIYKSTTSELKTLVSLRSCHVILMLDNLVRLKYIADPSPGEHRSKQLCTLPITLQGLPLDSLITEQWHSFDCDGSYNCSCKQRVQLKKSDIQHTLLEPTEREQLLNKQFFNLMTFGYTLLWKRIPDDLLEHTEGKRDSHATCSDIQNETCSDEPDFQSDNALDDDTDCTELDVDLEDVLKSIEVDHDAPTEVQTKELDEYSDEEFERLSAMETSMQNMSILDETIEKEDTSVKDLLQSFGFHKNIVPPLLTRHPMPAVGRDDDPAKIREILDDVLVKMGYEADPRKAVNRILCGPDNKIGKCLLSLLKTNKRYEAFLPEFPVLHLRKSKINILFSSFKHAGLIELIKYMRDEAQDDWTKLISLAHIDMATKYVKRIALALHLAFLIAFMEYLEKHELQEFLNDMEVNDADYTSSRWSSKLELFLAHGSSRNATFELHVDMMKHCDEIVAIALSERIGGKDGYALMLSAVKSSLPFSFVNNASAYAPYCVKLLHSHYSAGFFHQSLKEELFSTPFKSSNKNFGTDTKREMDHLDALKGFRSGSTVSSATCRMSLIDSLNESKGQTSTSPVQQTDDDNLGWELTEKDMTYIYPATALILRRHALSVEENQVPYNVYSKIPLKLPTSILDSCSKDVGKYLLMRYLHKEKMFGLDNPDCLKDIQLQGPPELVSRAKRSKGVTIKRIVQSKVQQVRTETQEKEESRQKAVMKETKVINYFSSENNACQALVKADSSKPKVLKSIGVQKALLNLVQACTSTQQLDHYIAVNMVEIPRSVITAMKICVFEFAGVKFKTGTLKSGQEYIEFTERVINSVIEKSERVSTVVVCEEKYGFTPDTFKAGTRKQRQDTKQNDVNHLKTSSNVITDTSYNKDFATKTDMGKRYVSTYLAQHIARLNIKKDISMIVDSEYIVEKDCECDGICECVKYCVPILRNISSDVTKDAVRNMTEIHQRKGEAEMAVVDWLLSLQNVLQDGDAAVCFVTSADIDAVYIHLFAVSRLWEKDDKKRYKHPVYVILQKPGGKFDVYNITAILMLLEEYFKDSAIGCKLAIVLSMGGNDFIPKLFAISHDTVCKFVFDNSNFRNTMFAIEDGRYYLNKEVYVELVKSIYTPKRLRDSSVSYEDVRALSIAKREDSNKKSGFRTTDPRKWLPPQSAVERLASLVQLQIDYLHTAGKHESKPLNFLDCNCLKKNTNGEIEYNFGPEAHFMCVTDLPSLNTTTQKRHLKDTPQQGARKKRQLTSTPRKH